MKIVFMGSPDFAVPSLEALVEARFDVRLVVTQPDRKAGRGRKLLPTAVKAAARQHGLPVLDFGQGDRKVTAAVLAAKPDAVVVVAFGHILREPLLSTPPFGCINVHASLLPRWRGVSPVQYAILHGDSWSGVTIMRMDAGRGHGPCWPSAASAIGPEETAGDLLDRLAGQGADLLIHTLRSLENGQVEPAAPERRRRGLRAQADPHPLGRPLGPRRGHGPQPDPRPVALARYHHLSGRPAAEDHPGAAHVLP